MADVSDVENAFKALIVSKIYANGTAAPSVMKMDNNAAIPAVVMRGWPNKTQLQRDLAAGVCTINIWPRPGSDQDVTPMSAGAWQQDTARMAEAIATPVTMTFSATGGVSAAPDRIVFGGPAAAAQNVSVVVDGRGYHVSVTANQTAASIAAAFAALISADRTATSNGATLDLPGAHRLQGASGAIVSRGLWREINRTKRVFQIGLWCPSPEQRDAAGRFLNGVLRGKGTLAGHLSRFDLADGSTAHLQYQNTQMSDDPEMAGLFRRDFFFSVEYGDIEFADAAQIVQIETHFTPHGGGGGFGPGEEAPPALLPAPIVTLISS
jgi:hypothetical protein